MLQYVLGSLAKPEVASSIVEFLIRLLVSADVQRYLRRFFVYVGVSAGAMRLWSLRFVRERLRKLLRERSPRRRFTKARGRDKRRAVRTR